jgi:3-oxoacyl-[acyl-carrier protein] reductase/meso-butanediol dehydrogenase/(S,S)-butanediol dehydrogenase/diacetyl reductase
VTGGTRGIGAEIVQSFAAAGWKVYAAARTVPKEPATAVEFVAMDATEESGHRAAVERCMDGAGRLDAYVNCAGLSAWRPLRKIDSGFVERMLAVNLKSVIWGCKTAATVMQRGAAIVNVSSLAGKRGSANNTMYCAAKFGVNGVTQSLAKELGPLGIRVNAMCPVYVQTPGLLEALEQPDSPAGGRDVATYLGEFTALQAALGVLPTGSDVAALCRFLCSDSAAAITGQCINIDCGVLPQ